MSINWQPDAGAALLVLPPDVASLDEADAAIELWEHYSGKTLDPSQRLVVQVMMAQRADGTWAASTTGREMARQNGKGDELEVVELWGLVQRSEAILHTLHDAVLLASQAQQRLMTILDKPDLRRKVKKVWRGTGQQMIEMHNGGTIWYRTRTGGGARGVDDVDRLVVDEAQHATEEHLAAISPTLLANANPQMNVAGTAGLPGQSAWWWQMRLRALSADPGAFGYVGHTAERLSLDDDGRVVQGDVDVQDRSLWERVNPAVRAGRGAGMPFLEEQLRRLGEDKFAQEHLCVWAPPPQDSVGVEFDADRWAELVDVEAERPSPIVLAVATSTDRQWSHIGLAGRRADGLVQLEIVQSRKGTGWVADRVAELQRDWKPQVTVVNMSGPDGSLAAKLDGARVRYERRGASDYQRACGLFADGFADGTFRHSGQRQVTVAVGAAKRKVGARDSFEYVSRSDAVDVAPLRALCLALHELEGAKQKRSTGNRRAVVM